MAPKQTIRAAGYDMMKKIKNYRWVGKEEKRDVQRDYPKFRK
ncbi:hypothetical protein UNSWDHB_1335 [Dehalobacter sp. UNSWDHB]|nr:hypothetical protein DHBDCA_p374 [Dehalobacter sp. DCA]AFV04440.1 hypothetical protein DCF50_p434 [Dehalobacter sp. CF]EQB21335.1 hypothetical protein UNSWDHB_1335 [Dehalobacter sp. UNSWDHB]